MGLFSRTTLISSGVFHGLTDYHSHILPGVDDGIRTMEDSIAVLKYFETLGVAEVWCTPHIMEDIPNTVQRLRCRFDELCAAYDGPIRLHLAAEHMMDSLFIERLAANDVLPLTDTGDHLLVETSYFSPPSNLDDILLDVMSAGYFPVLAHPERYVYMDTAEYDRLHGRGVKFQLNLLSLTGAYGSEEQKKAQYLLKNGMYSFKGTDIHSLKNFAQRIKNSIKVKL